MISGTQYAVLKHMESGDALVLRDGIWLVPNDLLRVASKRVLDKMVSIGLFNPMDSGWRLGTRYQISARGVMSMHEYERQLKKKRWWRVWG